MDWNRPRKYEFALLVGVVAVLVLLLLGALSRVQDEVEEAAVQAEVAALRTELLEWLAHREVRGGKVPESRNPLAWIGRRPPGYLGELSFVPEQRGVWYYDRRNEELVYRYYSGREAHYRLVRGNEAAEVPGRLAGIGLWRVAP